MDWSWLDSAFGALIGIVAYAAGRGARSSRRPQLSPEPEAVCGCGHHYALHDDAQVCHGTSRQLMESGRDGRRYVTEASGCSRYSGPEPLPRYIAGS